MLATRQMASHKLELETKSSPCYRQMAAGAYALVVTW
jgi:hypothetical protein